MSKAPLTHNQGTEFDDDDLYVTTQDHQPVEQKHKLSSYAGVMLPVSRITERIIEIFNKRNPSEVSVWGLYDELNDIVTADMGREMNSLTQTAFKMLVSQVINEDLLDTNDFGDNENKSERPHLLHILELLCKVCDSQISYNNPSPGFYLDSLAYDRGCNAWPVVSVNSEGFHHCIGVITQHEQKYVAMPFIKEVPHVSPNEFINNVMEDTFTPRIKSLEQIQIMASADLNAVAQNAADQSAIKQPIEICIAKYIYATPLYELMTSLENGEYINDEPTVRDCMTNLCKSLLISSDMDQEKLTYANMFKGLADNTINLLENSTTHEELVEHLLIQRMPVKKYNDISLAMTDIINITQVGMKATQQKEVSNFLHDFLNS